MNLLKILPLLFLSGLSHAQDLGIISAQELLKKTKADQELYLEGLQEAVHSMNAYDRSRFDFKSMRSPSSIPKGSCMNDGGIVQPLTAEGQCPPVACAADPSLQQCQPVLYGDACIPSSSKAPTITCEQKSSMAKTLRQIKDEPAIWSVMQKQYQGICEGADAERAPCLRFRGLISKLNAVASNETGPGVRQAEVLPVVVARTPPPADLDVPGGTSAPKQTVKETVPTEVANPVVQKGLKVQMWPTTSTTSAGSKPSTGPSACVVADFLESVSCQYGDLESRTVVDIPEAYDIFCRRRAITPDEEKTIRARIGSIKKCLSPQKKSKRFLKRAAKRELADFSKRVEPAAELCLKELKAGRPPANDPKAILQKEGQMVNLISTDHAFVQTSTHIHWAGRILQSIKTKANPPAPYPVDLCQTKLQGFEENHSSTGTSATGQGASGHQ